MRWAILFIVVSVAAGLWRPATLQAADPEPDPVPFSLHDESPKYVTKTWSVEDGLPLNVVWTIEQTQNGMLWAGTLDGLARFDGHSMKTYTAPETSELAGNRVVALHEDAEGTLWVATQTGVSTYRDGTFRRIETVTGHIGNFGEGPNGTVWMSGPDGLYRSTADSVTSVPLQGLVRRDEGARSGQDTPDGTTVAGIGEMSAWVGVGDALWRYEEGTFRRPERLNAILESPIHAMTASAGRLIIATEAALIVVEDGRIDRYDHDGGSVGEIELAPSGEVWMTTYSAGLLRLADGTLERVDAGGSLTGRLRGLVRDESGQWWVGDHDDGLVRLQPRLIWPVDGDILDGSSARGVYADNSGAIWAGIGIDRVFRFTDSTRTQWSREQGIAGQFVRPIAEDESGAVWVGTTEGLLRKDGPRFEQVVPSEFSELKQITALQRDAADTLWVGTAEQGLFWHRAGTFGRAFSGDSPISSRVMGLHRSWDGTLWVGTRDDGVIRRVPGEGVEVYDADDGVPYKSVRDIYETEDGTIWISTSGGGIARFEGDHFTPVTTDDGLPHRSIHLIREAPEGIFWMSSNGGVFRVPRSQVEAVADGRRDRLYAQTFGTEDGMPDRECNGPIHPAGAKDPQGRLWFPTVDGLAVVDAQSPQLAVPDSVPVQVTSIRADGRSRPLDLLRFAPSTYRFEIDFTAISIRHADDLSFRYRLDGGTWTAARGRRTAEFTSLAAGTHRFEVQATVNGETWYTMEAPMRFRIAPHFYQTWWFRVLVVLLLIGLYAGAYRWRTHRLEKRQEALEAAVEERTQELAEEKEKTQEQAERLAELDEAKNRFFAHVSHEFRTPLSLILSPLRDAQQRAEEGSVTMGEGQLRRMISNAERLQRLIDQLLDLATLEAGQMELDRQPGDLARLIERTVEAFRSRAEEKDLDLHLQGSAGRIEMRFDPEKVETIVSNLVGNAVKFTPKGGSVAVRIEETEAAERVELSGEDVSVTNAIRVEVEDTGPGMGPDAQTQIFDRFEQVDNSLTREHEGTGLGLALTKQLVELHGGTIDVESAPGEGSRFIVHLPRGPVVSGDGAWAGESMEAEERGRVPRPDGEEERTRRRGRDGASVRTGDVEEGASQGEERATILVVEDNAEMRAYLREELHPHWTVLQAADGEEGWETVQEETPDLVLSDVMMPETDGFELCRRIKDDPDLRTIPVLLLTARADEEATLQGLESGADDYVAKPFGSEELKRRIENHLSARQHLEARYREEVTIEGLGAVVAAEDRPFVEEVLEAIEEQLSDPDFGVGDLADAVALSRRQLTRRLKKTVERAPGELIKQRRLKQAKEILKRDPGTIAEVGYAVGFRSASHFSNVFREEIGQTPSEFAEQHDG